MPVLTGLSQAVLVATAPLGRDAARDAARAELTRQPYADAQPPLLLRLVGRALRAVSDLFAGAAARVGDGRLARLLLIAVVVGIVAVHFTGWLWLDPLLGIGVALNIIFEGGKLVWRSSQGLMDEAMPAESMAAVQATLDGFLERAGGGAGAVKAGPIRFDDIATRRAGQRLFADLHMHVPGDWPLQRAATLRDELEQALMDNVPGLRVTIQLLPLNMEARAVQMAPGA